MADDPILERVVRERIDGAANPADAAAVIMGYIAARLTAHAGERATASLLYAMADQAAVSPAARTVAKGRAVVDRALREHAAAERLRPYMGGDAERHVKSAARLLLHLLDRDGRRSPAAALLEAVRDPFGISPPSDGLVKVVACHARKALAAAGVPREALVTIYGRGMLLAPQLLDQVRALVEPRDG